ncbi:phosphotransferase [Rhodococcus sp. NPDC056960]|uniref:phosphotransferase n=1 Tax=Rhodococcus sp. NPDC056960 TaxID=3345982 RepID=UPI00363EAF3A
MLDTSDFQPSAPDEITAAWLTGVLRLQNPTLTVEHLEVTKIIWGTATKVLLEATYSGQPDVPLSRNLCVKGGLDRRLDNVSDDAIHTMEARFYGELRHLFESSAPECYYAGVDRTGGKGLIVLEDIAAAGSTFVEPGDVLTVDQVASGLSHQAKWHAATWGKTAADLPGVGVGSITRKAAKLFYREKYWNSHFAQEGAPQYPAELQNPDLLYRAFKKVWESDDVAVHSLQHGDAHLGNTFLRPDGDLGFIDWQCYCFGPWSYDVALFLSGALSVEDRRSSERDLLRGYLDQLAAAGGPRITFDEAWADYVRHLVHGLMWTMTPKVMQPFERSRIMSDRYVTAVMDHGAVADVYA